MSAWGTSSESVSWLPVSHWFSHVAEVSSSSMCCLSDRINVHVQLREANRTLSDETSDELLLLYGRTDTTLEIALVEHGVGLVVGRCCNR